MKSTKSNFQWVYDGYEVLKKTFPVKNPIYLSVEDFVNRNTFIQDLVYAKFKVFFYFYIVFILLYTIFHVLNLATKKRRPRLKFRKGARAS